MDSVRISFAMDIEQCVHVSTVNTVSFGNMDLFRRSVYQHCSFYLNPFQSGGQIYCVIKLQSNHTSFFIKLLNFSLIA